MAIQNFLEPGLLIIIIVLVALIIFFIVLTFIQKRLKKKIAYAEEKVLITHAAKSEIDKLKEASQPSNEILIQFDKFAQKTLKAHYQLPDKLDYSELATFFKRINKQKIEEFCSNMLKTLYSGSQIDKTKLQSLLSDLETIMKQERIHPLHVRSKMLKTNKIKPAQMKEKIIKREEITLKDPIVQKEPDAKPIQIQTLKPIPKIKTAPVMKQTLKDLKKNKKKESKVQKTMKSKTIIKEQLKTKTPVVKTSRKSSKITKKKEEKKEKKRRKINIESIDNLHRIETRLEMRQRLRREANSIYEKD